MATRDRLLDATVELFGVSGYSGTGLKRIGVEAGAPFGSIYHHFPGGKEQLGEEAIRRAGQVYLQLVMEVARTSTDPVRAVHSVFAGAAEVLAASGYRDICPVATVALEVASSNERLRAATAEVFDGWVTTLAEFLVSTGVPDRSGRALATVLIELLEGAFMLSRAARDTGPVLAAGEAATALVTAALAETEVPR